MAQIKVDFRGAPPVTGGGMRDHIPPGRYRLSITSMEDTTSKTGKRMITATYRVTSGEHQGANLGDNFVLEDNNHQPSKIGLGRLHHLLLCLKLPVKEAPTAFDPDRLSGMEFEADVVDEHFKGQDGSDRLSSNVKAYYPLSSNGSKPEAITVSTEEPAAPWEEPETKEEEKVEETKEESIEAISDEIEDLFK